MPSPPNAPLRLAELEAYIQERGHRPVEGDSLGHWIRNVRGGRIDSADETIRARVDEIVATVPTEKQSRTPRREPKPTPDEKRAEQLEVLRAYVSEHGTRPPMSHALWWRFSNRLRRGDEEFLALWESVPPPVRHREVRFGLDGRYYAAALTADEEQALRDALAPYISAGRRTRKTQYVTRREAAGILGYSDKSLASLMNRNPARWPAPVRTLKTGRTTSHLYDLDALREAAGTVGEGRFGKGASLSGADGLITCLYCGRQYRALGTHLARAHGTNATDYRAEHNLPRTGSMMSDVTRTLEQTTRRQMLADDPSILDHLKPYHTAEHLSEIGQRGVDAVRASHTIPLAEEHRRPGREYAVSRMLEQRMIQLTRKTQAHGYADVDDAIAQTLHLPAKAAARVTGLSASTITRWRQKQAGE